MKNATNAQLFAVATLIAVMVALATWWVTAGLNACRPSGKFHDDSMKLANGCIEFWFNRYQTTVQTLFSTVIGAIGILFVVRQLKELAKQNEMARIALEANVHQLRILQEGAKAKAFAAIGNYRNATLHMRDAFRDKLAGKELAPDRIHNDQTEKWLPEINAGIAGVITRDEWDAVYDNYVDLYHHLSIEIGVLKLDRLDAFNQSRLPTSTEDAIARCEAAVAEMNRMLKLL